MLGVHSHGSHGQGNLEVLKLHCQQGQSCWHKASARQMQAPGGFHVQQRLDAVLMQMKKNEGELGCTYRSNSTSSGDEVLGYWLNTGFPSSSIVCFSHSCIRYKMVESLSLTAPEGDAVLKRTHRKKSQINNFLTGLITSLSWSLQSPRPFFLSWFSLLLLLCKQTRPVVETSCAGG